MTITYNNIEYEISESYSFKDMTGWDLSAREDMDGIVIYGSCLSHETPDAETLPTNLTGATFIKCNLDNVKVPPGNTVIDCSVRRFSVQNDLEDWIINPVTRAPVEPINRKMFESLGLSIDPRNIPAERQSESATNRAIREAGERS